MSEAFKEMSTAYHLLTNKVEIIEKRNILLEKRFEQIKNLREQTVETKTPGSSSTALMKSASSCETTLDYAEQACAVLHQPGSNSIHFEKPSSSQAHVKAIEERLAETEHNIRSLQEQLNSSNAKAYESQLCQYEDALIGYKGRFTELEQLSMTYTCSTNGEYLWHIPKVNEKVCNARSGQSIYIESSPFYTGRNGYKMCIRVYLNGDGSGEKTHLSIFFVLMRGEYDPLLQWPFEPNVSLILVDQDHKRDLVQTFKPNAQSSNFQRPKTDMNVASGCPEFADLIVLDNTSYVKDDVMYIKAIVDTSKI